MGAHRNGGIVDIECSMVLGRGRNAAVMKCLAEGGVVIGCVS